LTTTYWTKKGGELVMQTGQVLMILACDGHVETIRRCQSRQLDRAIG
jgi:hypothetical protein